MNMPEGLKNITVQAINKLLLASDQVIYNFTAVHSKPTKKGMRLHLSKQYINLHGVFFSLSQLRGPIDIHFKGLI